MAPHCGLSKSNKVIYGQGLRPQAVARKKTIPINRTAKQLEAAKSLYQEQLQALSYVQREEIMGSGSTEDVDMLDAYEGEEPDDWEDTYDGPLYHTLLPGEEGLLHSHAGAEVIFDTMTTGMRPSCGDPRLWNNRVQQMINSWTRHMPRLVNALMEWKQVGSTGKESIEDNGAWPL
ncbi:unnamed protein product [Mycena citricolor]|uniref:Uncharacterized protein n=1 Tax=Mycena citricolor TaxID=2018698 RepID=A0AAD2HS25_9AGAR|nr:unnamed protein product [Mycena citricolor]